MILAGIIIGVLGSVMWYGGVRYNADIEKQFSYFWETGSKDITGDMLIRVGIVLLVCGIVLVVLGFIKYLFINKGAKIFQKDNQEIQKETSNNTNKTTVLCVNSASQSQGSKNKYCTNCGAEITGTGKFCSECGMKVE